MGQEVRPLLRPELASRVVDPALWITERRGRISTNRLNTRYTRTRGGRSVDPFAEQGTTPRRWRRSPSAPVTRSTLFRHYSDKCEVSVAGQETLSQLLAEGITEAPVGASPLEAVAAGRTRVE